MFTLHAPIDKALRELLIGYNDLTAALLSRRGIHSPEDAEAFLNPSYEEHIGDPLTILNMPRAAERIARAIDTQEKLCVWSDYDCDGIPGGVLLHDFFKKAKANFVNYIPHRHEEGFGLNTKGIDALHLDGVSLIITVDCGIADIEEVAYAQSLGIDVIVTDHHLPKGTLPPAYAVIDPKQDGETYSFKDFCGAGVAWKLACAVLAHGFVGREDIPKGWEKWLLDMAGLATIADMVPLTGENRVIAKYGLVVLRKSPRVGLQKLCRAAGVKQAVITEDDIAFMIAARVNAASRMGNPRDAFQLFTTTDEVEAGEIARALEKLNRSRRALCAATTRQVHERLEERKRNGTLPPVIAMGDPDWRPGLMGLVASTIADEYERPVFLWGREGSMSAKGSCRAGKRGIHLPKLMEAAEDTFEDFGGHMMSGGFTLKDDAMFFFEERMTAAYEKLKDEGIEEVPLYADSMLLPEQASMRFLRELEALAPFGMGNPKPLFAFTNITVSEVSWFGKGQEHLKLMVSDQFDTSSIEAIAFFAKRDLGAKAQSFSVGAPATILACVERNQFSRRSPVRLRIVAVS